MHLEGVVVLLAHIGADGLIKNLYVESEKTLLTPSAIDAVSQWKYKPYLMNGKPVEVETQITIPITLR